MNLFSVRGYLKTKNLIICLLTASLLLSVTVQAQQVPPQFRPNDPVIDETMAGQLGLFQVYAFEQVTQPIQTEVVLGVLDGPIDYSHPEFLDRLYPPINLTSDPTYEEDNPNEFNHGSFTASAALAATNNGKGVISSGGFSGKVKGQGFKVLASNGNVTFTSFRAALQAVLQQRAAGINIKVLTGGWAFSVRDVSGQTDQLLDQLATQGVVLVWGVNSRVNPVNLDDNCIEWPVCYAQTHWNVIPVAPLQADGMTLSSVSDFGPNLIQFAAPGDNKVVGFLNRDTGSTSFSGPTPAAALVAGALLLVELYRQPDAQLAIQLLKDGSTRLPSLQGKVKSGRRVNPFGALMPVIVIDPDAVQLDSSLALEAITQKTGPFKVSGEFLFAKDKADKVSRIVLNVQNVSLLPGEGPSAVTVEAVDSQGNRVFLPVEAVAALVGASHYTQVVVKLSANNPGEPTFPELATGSVNLTLTYHQQVSNMVTIQVVH